MRIAILVVNQSPEISTSGHPSAQQRFRYGSDRVPAQLVAPYSYHLAATNEQRRRTIANLQGGDRVRGDIPQLPVVDNHDWQLWISWYLVKMPVTGWRGGAGGRWRPWLPRRPTEGLTETVESFPISVGLALPLPVGSRDARNVRQHHLCCFKLREAVVAQLYGEKESGIVTSAASLHQLQSVPNQLVRLRPARGGAIAVCWNAAIPIH
jgi:hypothetical protein